MKYFASWNSDLQRVEFSARYDAIKFAKEQSLKTAPKNGAPTAMVVDEYGRIVYLGQRFINKDYFTNLTPEKL